MNTTLLWNSRSVNTGPEALVASSSIGSGSAAKRRVREQREARLAGRERDLAGALVAEVVEQHRDRASRSSIGGGPTSAMRAR